MSFPLLTKQFRRYVSKSIPPGSEFEFSQDNSSKRSQSESPRKKLFKDLLLSSEDSSASPGRRRISSIDRDSPNASFRQGRLSEIGQANRDGILKKMFYFCERHNLDVLVDQLASIHRIMLSTEFRLKEAYEKASTEVNFLLRGKSFKGVIRKRKKKRR